MTQSCFRARSRAPAPRGKPCPARIFNVPGDVLHLSPEQMEALGESVRAWLDEARGPATRLSRARVYLVFLVLRYTGAKLGEVLGLDETQDVDLQAAVIRFKGQTGEDTQAREVRLPEEARAEMARIMSEPMALTVSRELFRLDGGYIRRKFYERAKAARVPKELANPRVLRHSRAVELLRSGVPLSVVQAILGHASVGLTAHYLSFSEEDLRAIAHYYIQKENRMKTSARNSFTGPVTAIRYGMILSEVELKTPAGHHVVSVITKESLDKLGLVEGAEVTATVKAPFVILVKDEEAVNTSARNRFQGAIARINEGQIAAEVVVTLPDSTEVCALVTDVSVQKLGLKVGERIWVMFKAFSVVLNVD